MDHFNSILIHVLLSIFYWPTVWLSFLNQMDGIFSIAIAKSRARFCWTIAFNIKFKNFRNGTSKSEPNPFEEEEWDEGDNESVLVDNGEPGVPVKALYDYEGAESDELTFKQGEISNGVQHHSS